MLQKLCTNHYTIFVYIGQEMVQPKKYWWLQFVCVQRPKNVVEISYRLLHNNCVQKPKNIVETSYRLLHNNCVQKPKNIAETSYRLLQNYCVHWAETMSAKDVQRITLWLCTKLEKWCRKLVQIITKEIGNVGQIVVDMCQVPSVTLFLCTLLIFCSIWEVQSITIVLCTNAELRPPTICGCVTVYYKPNKKIWKKLKNSCIINHTNKGAYYGYSIKIFSPQQSATTKFNSISL